MAERRSQELRVEPVGGPPLAPFTLSGEAPALIGRGQSCTVCLADPSVSRDHATVARRGGQWFITDLHARHGTQLNGTALAPERPALLASGDMLRIGPYTLRIRIGGEGSGTLTTTTDGGTAAGMTVERVPALELQSLIQRRLELLTEGAAAIYRATEETALAEAVLDLVLAGSGYQRGAVLRHTGSTDAVEIVASRDRNRDGDEGPITPSRSLIAEAASGHVARLAKDAPVPAGMSITRLSIHSALCAPIFLDEAVVGSIYLDSREDEQPGHPDAGGFCHAVSRLAGLALSNLKRAELAARQKRLDDDLDAARQAQKFLLPADEGDAGHLHYALRTHPGRVVAGDLFDLFPLGEDRVAVCCGDVTGQGMGAAILMTAVLAHIRAAMSRFGEPAAVVREVNLYIAERSPQNMFASLWVGVFDHGGGTLRYVDAGHGHWLMRRAGGEPQRHQGPSGLLIGIEPAFEYEPGALELAAGDRIILYSDGVVEHRSAAGEAFGTERLRAVLAAAADPAGEVDAAMTALRAHIGDLALEDDTTIASIEVRGT